MKRAMATLTRPRRDSIAAIAVAAGISALLNMEAAFAQSPALDECLNGPAVIQYEEKTGGDVAKTIKLMNLDASSSIIHVEACGSGGGGGRGASTGSSRTGGGGGGSAPLQSHMLVCGKPFTAAHASSPSTVVVDCSKPIEIRIPGRAGEFQNGAAVELRTFKSDGAVENRIELAPGGEAPKNGDSEDPRSGGGGFQAGGTGGTWFTYGAPATMAKRGGSVFGFGGGAVENAGRAPGGGGGASMRGNGGRGGRVVLPANGNGRDGSKGGVCAGGGGGAGPNDGSSDTSTGGRGGPGWARVTVFSLRQAALCGGIEVVNGLEPTIREIVKEEVAKATATVPPE